MRVPYKNPKKWTSSDRVVGSRKDVTRSGIQRLCLDCREVTFTNRVYPDDVPVMCEVCFENLPDPEVLENLSSDPELMTDVQLVRLCRNYKLWPKVTLPELESEAASRGVDVLVVIREKLIALLKAHM